MARPLSEQPTLLRAWPVSTLPLRLHERRSVLLLGDGLVLLAASLVALMAWAALAPDVVFGWSLVLRSGAWTLGLGLAWLALWAGSGGYDLRLATGEQATRRRLLATALVFGVGYLALYFVISLPVYAFRLAISASGGLRPLRLLPMLFIAATLPTQMAWRSLYARVLTRGRFRRRVLVVGAGQSGQTIVRTLYEQGDGTYDVVGFVDDDPAKQGWALRLKCSQEQADAPQARASYGNLAVRVLGDRHALKRAIAEHSVSSVVLAITHEADGELLSLLIDCLELGVEIIPMPVLYEELTGRVPVEHVGSSWYVAMPVQHPSTGSLFRVARRSMDIVLAGLGLMLLGLAFPFIAVAIYLDSPGPIFYSQERVGKGGRTFRAYKFRSMVPDAENGQAVWAQENDDRVTRVGRILRKTHVDEFPQFVNILKGEMSAVGPRPERPEFAEELAREMPFYRVRHAVKPGMAGWALVRQGYASSKEDALIRLQYDLYYIKHQSIWLDLVILFRTVLDTLTFRGR